jgi:hypothetical protein
MYMNMYMTPTATSLCRNLSRTRLNLRLCGVEELCSIPHKVMVDIQNPKVAVQGAIPYRFRNQRSKSHLMTPYRDKITQLPQYDYSPNFQNPYLIMVSECRTGKLRYFPHLLIFPSSPSKPRERKDPLCHSAKENLNN